MSPVAYNSSLNATGGLTHAHARSRTLPHAHARARTNTRTHTHARALGSRLWLDRKANTLSFTFERKVISVIRTNQGYSVSIKKITGPLPHDFFSWQTLDLHILLRSLVAYQKKMKNSAQEAAHMFNLIHNIMTNHIFNCGTLTIRVYVSPTYKNGQKVWHGTSHVKTIKGVLWRDVQEEIQKAIQEYLQKCKFKEADRTFSWKFETY